MRTLSVVVLMQILYELSSPLIGRAHFTLNDFHFSQVFSFSSQITRVEILKIVTG